jgi:primase-polymerase (primpol)-like protein
MKKRSETMKKSKFIEDEARKQYIKQLNEFSQKINPKPTLAEREQLRKEYLEKRAVHETDSTDQ